MNIVIEKAVAAINLRLLERPRFEGTAKFVIIGEGCIVVDSDGAHARDDNADVTLRASRDIFAAIIAGEQSAKAAFMCGTLSVEGDIGLAMKLGGVLG